MNADGTIVLRLLENRVNNFIIKNTEMSRWDHVVLDEVQQLKHRSIRSSYKR